MAIKTTTSLSGIQIPFSQISGPLAKLFSSDSSLNYTYPQDLATNPAMCHAVQFTIYDWTTDVSKIAGSVIDKGAAMAAGLKGMTIEEAAAAAKAAKDGVLQSGADLVVMARNGQINAQTITSAVDSKFQEFGTEIDAINQLANPLTYTRRKGETLSVVSLYMPDTLTVNYDAHYGQVSMTDAIGPLGRLASTLSGVKKDGIKSFLSTPYAKEKISEFGGKIAEKVGGNAAGMSDILKQSAGIVLNPQMQMLYTGVDFRTFNLEFVFTPKSAAESDTVRKIIDTFTYYSSPGVAGAGTGDGTSGQYLTPPQLFDIKFKFTGKSGASGAIENAFQKAFNNIGLGFLNTNNVSDTIQAADDANIFRVGECVLENIGIDYAPNGWSTFTDGSPVQTRLTLTFKETQIVTKERMRKEGMSFTPPSSSAVKSSINRLTKD